MSIRIHRARIEDVPAIERFICRAYRELSPFKGPDRWRWQFVENPFLPDAKGFVPVWVARDGDEVVGQIAVQATEVKVAETVYSAGWIVDVIILPAYRGRGLGHLLLAAVAHDVSFLFTLTMAPATRRMFARRGAIALGSTRQFSRWTRLRADDVRRFLIQRTVYHDRVARAARWACDTFAIHRGFALLSNVFLGLRDRGFRLVPRSASIVEVEHLGKEVDDLWQKARDQLSSDLPAEQPVSQLAVCALPTAQIPDLSRLS